LTREEVQDTLKGRRGRTEGGKGEKRTGKMHLKKTFSTGEDQKGGLADVSPHGKRLYQTDIPRGLFRLLEKGIDQKEGRSGD